MFYFEDKEVIYESHAYGGQGAAFLLMCATHLLHTADIILLEGVAVSDEESRFQEMLLRYLLELPHQLL